MNESFNTEALIQDLVSRYGESKAESLVAYIDMVLERNQFINLTAVRDRDEAMQKHLVDSLSVTALPEYIQADRIIDVGTGAGFPGALLAIADPDKEFVLLDSTLKRLRVIDEFAAQLGINNITTVHARAEEIQMKPDFDAAFDLCVSRAVASLDKLAGWCLPFVRSGGSFIAYKAANYSDELKAAEKILSRNKGKLERVVHTGEYSTDISGHVLLVIGKR